eukprot:TRINITY_DN4907_c0_g1_i1.p1 TRINITY_DN4907_c0_g1~~TRINITY_DN4907_c0_g1_i1.p1  ORF type:complete len:194 (+),score=79.37 TRINITY_DN4907_c0_g1_i1:74-655(+)
MSHLDLSGLAAAHYKLLAAVTSREGGEAAQQLANAKEEADSLLAESSIVELECKALEADAAQLKRRSQEIRGKTQEVDEACQKLRHEADHYHITEECTAKYDALLEDLTVGKSLQELAEEVRQEEQHQSKQETDACDESELDALKVHLSQLYDVACIASARCRYVLSTTDGEGEGERAQKKRKREQPSPTPGN